LSFEAPHYFRSEKLKVPAYSFAHFLRFGQGQWEIFDVFFRFKKKAVKFFEVIPFISA
jgi:hypothetical protein